MSSSSKVAQIFPHTALGRLTQERDVAESARRVLSMPPPRHPRILAKLDMQNEVERDTQAFLTRACSGRWPMWRLLGMRRQGDLLFVSVEWLRCVDARYSLVELSLDRITLCWRYYPTAAAARAALATIDAPLSLPQTPTVPSEPVAG